MTPLITDSKIFIVHLVSSSKFSSFLSVKLTAYKPNLLLLFWSLFFFQLAFLGDSYINLSPLLYRYFKSTPL